MDVNKFNIAQLFNNTDGKTSGSGFCGIITNIVGLICFIFGCFTKNSEIITNSVIVIGTASALLGVNKFRDNKPTTDEPESTTV